MGYIPKWRYIYTKYNSKCADCGSDLPEGTKVKWYMRSRKVYGIDCHTKEESRRYQTAPEQAEIKTP